MELDLRGEVVLIGCPAEEILWGKLALQAAGIFDGLDVILTSHGDYQNGALARPCHATATGEFKFEGKVRMAAKVPRPMPWRLRGLPTRSLIRLDQVSDCS